VFSDADLDTKIASLDEDEKEVRQEIAKAQTELIEAEQRWLDAKARHEQSAGRDGGSQEELQARQLDRDLQLETISLLNQRLAEIALENFVWNLRYRAVNGLISSAQLPEELRTLDGYRERQKQTRALLEIRIQDLRLELSSLDTRYRNARQTDAASARWLGQQIDRTQQLIGVIATNLVRQDAAGRLLEKTASNMGELSTDGGSAGQWARLEQLWHACWDYEITAIDDRPITVGKLVLGVVFLLIGYAVSRILSRSLGRRVLARLGLTPGASSALQTVSFYLMLTVFGFLSLELANVPLTVFTFLGGAVAIGVGFGSQNLMNNFISGLILLAERPVRVGDLVDIDGVNGTVKNIGARSTCVRSGSNLEILVPNSTFLENKVTNWTLSDTRIRISVAVGVAYGSPTRQVTQLLRQTVIENAEVLDDPEPLILFKEFGDNSLNFEVHFWVHMRTLMDGERIASEVRHTIDDLFRDADITIAYPQRDVHLDTVKPIEVNLRQVADARSTAFPRRDAA
jgi:small-conductance mechanosensitive channel